MPHSYTQIYLQLIFAVKYRRAVIHHSWANELFAVITNLIKEANCQPIIVNGVEDHVHCFVRMRPPVSVSELMKIVKGKSSKYINDRGLTKDHFEWQRGYGAFSYSQSQFRQVYIYIANQHQRHKRQTFRQEFRTLLQKFRIQHDDQTSFEELM